MMDIILNGRLIGRRFVYYVEKIARDQSYVRYWDDGSVDYLNSDGQLHREDGPAEIYSVGVQKWYRNGQLHREDGPAIIWQNGEEWWIDDRQVEPPEDQ